MRCNYCGCNIEGGGFYSKYWNIEIALFCSNHCSIMANTELMEVKEKIVSKGVNRVSGNIDIWTRHMLNYNYYIGE